MDMSSDSFTFEKGLRVTSAAECWAYIIYEQPYLDFRMPLLSSVTFYLFLKIHRTAFMIECTRRDQHNLSHLSGTLSLHHLGFSSVAHKHRTMMATWNAG